MRHGGRPVPRLFVQARLGGGAALPLSAPQRHYLSHVMRLGQGDLLRLFNGRDGEWLARLDASGATAVERLAPQPERDGPWLLFAPPRRERLRMLVEKATELGVAVLAPVDTERGRLSRVEAGKMRLWAIEAAEQCGRPDVPECRDTVPLAAALESWPAERRLYLCDRAASAGFASAAGASSAAFLVGPEGGFGVAERDRLLSLPGIVPLSLGPRTLRVETAAMAALAAWQVLRMGDRLDLSAGA